MAARSAAISGVLGLSLKRGGIDARISPTKMRHILLTRQVAYAKKR
jgi:hypothetical protein